ncbi:hypothetical protein F4775DRAFT_591171 [Biscogniauxia sp. FL1348]|nr:hypothetical protein F4775DRAFT_591171 [Biscogniauxia sp. FL1348]
MSDQKTASESTVPATGRGEPEQSKTQANADTKTDTKANTTASTEGEGDSVQTRPPNQLRSHFKGMPRQWEKNRDKFPPKNE